MTLLTTGATFGEQASRAGQLVPLVRRSAAGDVLANQPIVCELAYSAESTEINDYKTLVRDSDPLKLKAFARR